MIRGLLSLDLRVPQWSWVFAATSSSVDVNNTTAVHEIYYNMMIRITKLQIPQLI